MARCRKEKPTKVVFNWIFISLSFCMFVRFCWFAAAGFLLLAFSLETLSAEGTNSVDLATCQFWQLSLECRAPRPLENCSLKILGFQSLNHSGGDQKQNEWCKILSKRDAPGAYANEVYTAALRGRS